MTNDQEKTSTQSVERGDTESDTPDEDADQMKSSVEASGGNEQMGSYQVEPAPFPSLTPSDASGKAAKDLEFLADVNLEVTVELGRAEMSLREVLGLAPGVVIELDKLAGEPATILVNGKIVGRGEVVVIEDMFGVRVTEIIPPSQRWKYES